MNAVMRQVKGVDILCRRCKRVLCVIFKHKRHMYVVTDPSRSDEPEWRDEIPADGEGWLNPFLTRCPECKYGDIHYRSPLHYSQVRAAYKRGRDVMYPLRNQSVE